MSEPLSDRAGLGPSKLKASVRSSLVVTNTSSTLAVITPLLGVTSSLLGTELLWEMSPSPVGLLSASWEELPAAIVLFCDSFCTLVGGLGSTCGGVTWWAGDWGDDKSTGDVRGEVGFSPDFFLSWLKSCNTPSQAF